MHVPPLRPEQEGEPLAQQRLKELRALGAEGIRAEVARARRAGFAAPKMVRRHAREHGPSFGLEPQDTAAYLALAENIQRDPERLFSAYYGTRTRPTVKQWIFARENLLVVVAEYSGGFVLTTFYRATLERGSAEAISLDEYLRGRDHGRKMVEVKL